MPCGGLAENFYLLTLYVYPFLIFFLSFEIHLKQHAKECKKSYIIYCLMFVKYKSEFLLVLYRKFDMNTQEKHS